MAKKLVIYLVGRVCLVTEDADTWAVFLNAEHEHQLGLRKHTPLLSAPMSMVATQKVAGQALMTSGTFVSAIGRPDPLMDSMGVWSLCRCRKGAARKGAFTCTTSRPSRSLATWCLA